MVFTHVPVLLKESLELMNLKEGMTVVDCTLGGGGHTRAIAEKVGRTGKVIALDLYPASIQAIEKEKRENIVAVKANFKDIKKVVADLGIKRVDAILADLGFATDQLKAVAGLSFQEEEAFLDMRLGEGELTAAKVLAETSENELARIFWELGEEKRSKCIAEEIVKVRDQKPVEKVGELKRIVEKCWGGAMGTVRGKKLDVSTKVFMALRIYVNREMENLDKLLEDGIDILKTEGRMIIISFHSLEDRKVKNFFRRESRGCICEEDAWQCTCSHQASLKVLTKKPVRPSAEEVKENPKARSAVMRAAEKIEV